MTIDENALRIIEDTSKRISQMIVRGATNIAIEAMKSLESFIRNVRDNALELSFYKAVEILFKSRPTEPAMQNGIIYVLATFEKEKQETNSISELKNALITATREYISLLKTAINKIIEIGWRRVPENGIVMTHCHSSTVVSILQKAKDAGKKFIIISSETRPLYQGRKTSKELGSYGIKVYHIVDSAMRWAARKFKPDMALIGADAVTSTGVVINKIGSKLLALVAAEFDFPLYVATTLLKLDPKTLLGGYTPIEIRDPREVWENPPRNIEVLNPAFETIDPRYIDGIITEAGIIPPEIFQLKFESTYPRIWNIISSEQVRKLFFFKNCLGERFK